MLRKLFVSYVCIRYIDGKEVITFGCCVIRKCPLFLTERHLLELPDAIQERLALGVRPAIISVRRLWW